MHNQDFFEGTFAPDLRALLRPMAIACFLLLTFLPLPDFSFPSLNSSIVLPTFSCALSEYFFAMISKFMQVKGIVDHGPGYYKV
jgi:hypothetical protein